MIIQHNMQAMFANRELGITTYNKAKSQEKLSSGYKINRAADDAAGLTISEGMRRQIRGLNQGVNNTQDGISLLQVADGALAEVHDMLHKVTELSVQSANGTNTAEDREAIQAEITEILSEIDRISESTEFNTRKLFRGQKKEINTNSADPYQRMIDNSNEARSSIKTSIVASSSSTRDFNTNFSFITTNEPRSLSVNGTSIALSSISGSSGDFSSETISAGEYSMWASGGVRFSFTLDKDYTQEEVLRALNSLNMNVKGTAETIIPVRMVIRPDEGQYASNDFWGESGTKRHTLNVSESGIGIDGGTEVAWSSLGVNLDNASTFSGKNICVQDPDTHVMYRIITDQNVNTKDSFLSYLRQVSVTSHINLPHTTEHFRARENYGTIDRDSTYYLTYTKALYDKMGVNYGAPIHNTMRFEGDSVDNFSIILHGMDHNINQTFHLRASDAAAVLTPGGSGWVRFEDDTGSSLQMFIRNTNVAEEDFFSVLKTRSPVPEGAGIWYTTYDESYQTKKKMNITQGDVEFKYYTDAWEYDDPDPISDDDIYKDYNPLTLWIQSGANRDDGLFIKIGIMDTHTIGLSKCSVRTIEGAREAMEASQKATSEISKLRSSIGAQQNRLEHTVDNENNIVENTTAAESRIRDADMATEMMKFAKENILQQAGQAILSQTNQSRQGILTLLQ